MQCAFDILLFVACLAVQYFFFTLFYKRHKFWGVRCYWTWIFFLRTFVQNISHFKKNWARYNKKCILDFMESTRYSCPILIKLEFSQQIFEKCSNIKFCYNPFSGCLDDPCVQMDGRTEVQTDVTKLIVIFCNFANALEKYNLNKYNIDLVNLNALRFEKKSLQSFRSFEGFHVFPRTSWKS
jgi:hypothetical protein